MPKPRKLSVAIAKLFGTAMAGRCDERPGLAETPLELEARLPVVPGDGPDLVHALFEPLGYRVSTTAFPLDERFPAWGDARSLGLGLRASVRLRDLLGHLYVLLPVLAIIAMIVAGLNPEAPSTRTAW